MRIEDPKTNSLEDIEMLTTEKETGEIIQILEQFGWEVYRDDPAMEAEAEHMKTDSSMM